MISLPIAGEPQTPATKRNSSLNTNTDVQSSVFPDCINNNRPEISREQILHAAQVAVCESGSGWINYTAVYRALGFMPSKSPKWHNRRRILPVSIIRRTLLSAGYCQVAVGRFKAPYHVYEGGCSTQRTTRLILYIAPGSKERPVEGEVIKALNHYNKNVPQDLQVVFKNSGGLNFRLYLRDGQKPLTQGEIKDILNSAAEWRRPIGGARAGRVIYAPERGVTRELCRFVQTMRPGDLPGIEVVIGGCRD